VATSFYNSVITNNGGEIFNLSLVPKGRQQVFYHTPHRLALQKICEQLPINFYQSPNLPKFRFILNNTLLSSRYYRTTSINVSINNCLTTIQLQTTKEQIKDAFI